MKRYYRAVGGRKVGIGVLAAIILTIMAPLLDADFAAYATALLAALGITTTGVVAEDRARHRYGSTPPWLEEGPP